MTGYTHVTAPTQFAGVDGIRLAYRCSYVCQWLG